MKARNTKYLAECSREEDGKYWLHIESKTPLEKYPARQHARRVQEKLGVERGLVCLSGQAAKNNEDSDMPAPFRQLRYFYYLSGCNEADCHLAYDIRCDLLSLFIPRIDPKRVIWNGRGSTRTEALEKYDINEIYFVDQLQEFIQHWTDQPCNHGSEIFILHPSQILPKLVGVESRVNSDSLQPAMDTARMIKDDHEIKLIRRANDISSRAHTAVLASILQFSNEAQVEGLFMDVCISHQAKKQAYDPIAASGSNAGTLHYDANNEDFEDRQLMCLDAGCELENYASDITRTFPLAPFWPSQEARNIYELVQRMQQTCIEGLAPGIRYLDLHIRAHCIAIDGLLRLGILHNGTKEEIYKAGTSRAFFPHGLGHHVGLDVHDPGQAQLMTVRRGKAMHHAASPYSDDSHIPVFDPLTCYAPTDPHSSPLEEGMVVTVEPGIYFSVYALQHFYLPSPIHSRYIDSTVVARYLPIGGVRIEDDILITAEGFENLTTAPKGDDMLKIIRGEGANALYTSSRKSARQGMNEMEKPLRRAPGISGYVSDPSSKSIVRASTSPSELKQEQSGDFDLFRGPSLFSNFQRSMTTDENVRHWKQSHMLVSDLPAPQATAKEPSPLCGHVVSNFEHIYTSTTSNFMAASRTQFNEQGRPSCKNCSILAQTLDRLRQKLTLTAP